MCASSPDIRLVYASSLAPPFVKGREATQTHARAVCVYIGGYIFLGWSNCICNYGEIIAARRSREELVYEGMGEVVRQIHGREVVTFAGRDLDAKGPLRELVLLW